VTLIIIIRCDCRDYWNGWMIQFSPIFLPAYFVYDSLASPNLKKRKSSTSSSFSSYLDDSRSPVCGGMRSNGSGSPRNDKINTTHKDRSLQKIFLDDVTFETGRNTPTPLELSHATEKSSTLTREWTDPVFRPGLPLLRMRVKNIISAVSNIIENMYRYSFP